MDDHSVPNRSPRGTSPAALRACLIGSLIAAAALLTFNPPGRLGVTGGEAHWLRTAPGLARALFDAWTGAVAGDRLFRLPVVLLSLAAACAAAWIVARAAGSIAGALAGLATSALICVLAGPYLVGSSAPLALAGSLLCLAVIASRARPGGSALVLLPLAAALGALEPGLALLPLGAAGGALLARAPRPDLVARLASCGVAILLLGLLALHPELPWAGESGGRMVARSAMMLLVVAAGVLTAAAWRRGWSLPGGWGAAAGREEGPSQLLLPALGAFALPLAWLASPPLRSLTASPLAALLFLAAPLAILAAHRAWPAGALPAAPGARRPGVPAILTAAVVLWPLLAWSIGRERPPAALPLSEALSAMKEAHGALRELVAGPGLTRGVLAHAAGPRGLVVTPEPSRPVLGMVSFAALAPSLAERDRLSSLLGDRILDRYGVVGAAGPTLRWALFRPLVLETGGGAPRPNIAIISVDTLRADHLSFYGYGRETSPRLRRWSERALVYERAMAPAPSTAPSFGSLLTGRLPVSHGVRRNYEFLDPGNWPLPRILRRAGYETAGFVSSYVLSAENCGLDLGFDEWDETFDLLELNRRDRPIRLAPALSASVLRWLASRRPDDKPWFLWVHAIDPHGPYTPLPAYAGAFKDGPARELPRAKIPPYQWLGTTRFGSYLDAYDAEILQTDDYLGRIVEAIDAMASPRGTILVFVADHGEAFGEHGVYFDHGHSLHVEELHVPLVIEETGRPRAGRVPQVVSTLDVVPTILGRLGIGSDLPLDGLPLEQREQGAGAVLSNWTPGEVMVQRDRWKLMVRPGAFDRPITSLYDTVKDPREADPMQPPPEQAGRRDPVYEALSREALALIARDPLTPQLGIELDREQWRMLESEAQEKLRSLGYAAQ